MNGDEDMPRDERLEARLARADREALRALGADIDVEARLRRVKRLGLPEQRETPSIGAAERTAKRDRAAEGGRDEATPGGPAIPVTEVRPRRGWWVGADHTVAPKPDLPETGTAGNPPITLARIAQALGLLDIRFMADGGGSLLALWERHAVLFALEGPDDEILVMRARPHATVPPDWADRAYRTVNEWNHTRRFCKAYVGDPTERGQLPIYAELQVPAAAGIHDALLLEIIDCGTAVATSFVDWLHKEGALM